MFQVRVNHILKGVSAATLALLILSVGKSTWAADASASAAATTTVASSTAPDTAYQLSANDVIMITTVNIKDLTLPAVTVLPDGTINVPLLGAVQVAGLTTQQASDLLAKKWNDYVVNPSVTVALVTMHKEVVLVSGFITTPGSTLFVPQERVLDAIAAAGGALVTGDLSRATVTHPNGTVESLDLSMPETKGDSPANIFVQPGDNVYVPQRFMEVGVVGAVGRPGSLTFTDNMTVLDAVTQAGGVTDDANLSAAVLTHNGTDSSLDLDAMLHKGDMTQNVKLSPGDRIVIPQGNRAYIFGFVGKPGYYFFRPGDRILDALNEAGGPTLDADLSKVNFITVNKVTNVATLIHIDVDSFIKRGDPKGNPELQQGTVLYVPHKKQQLGVNSLLQALGGVNAITNTTRLLNGN